MTSSGSKKNLDLKIFESYLNTQILGKAAGWKNELWESITSTNDRAAELIRLGTPEGVVIMAHTQTKGRGRLKREWISADNAGIYMSMIVSPNLPLNAIPLITIAAGVAAAKAIRKISDIEISLKWINDLVYKDRKIGGILAEIPSNKSETSRSVVIGIGINLRLDRSLIAEDILDKVDSLENISSQTIDDNMLAAELVNCFEQTYFDLLAHKEDEILNAWREFSCTLGRHIKTVSASTSIEGKAIDIDKDGALIVEDSTGKQHLLHAGEVSIRAHDGKYI